jgi:hypothetical protein
VRLGAGDFVQAEIAIHHARMIYLAAIAEFVPEFVRTLAELVSAGPGGAGLQEWAKRWHFTDRWAYQFAEGHLALWRDDSQLIGKFVFAPSLSFSVSSLPPGPPLDFRLVSRATFNQRVEAHLEATKNTPGLIRTPEFEDHRPFIWLALFQVGGKTQAQIARNEQLRTGNTTISAVNQAIEKAARLAGVTRRETAGGRPRRTNRVR